MEYLRVKQSGYLMIHARKPELKIVFAALPVVLPRYYK